MAILSAYIYTYLCYTFLLGKWDIVWCYKINFFYIFLKVKLHLKAKLHLYYWSTWPLEQVTIEYEPIDNYTSNPIVLSSKNKTMNIWLKTSEISMWFEI